MKSADSYGSKHSTRSGIRRMDELKQAKMNTVDNRGIVFAIKNE